MGKNDLKREKRFQKHLEREFQVDTPPASYFQAVQDALDSLPDELPVKVRPLPQRVLRTCVALAACLVVAVGVATGINLVNPVLMESMPGVGQIFQELNHREEQKPSPTPEVESSIPYEEEGLPDIPDFEPAIFPLENNLGLLTVQNATCDGSTLVLELGLELWDTTMTSDSITVFSEASGEDIQTLLSVDGQDVEPFPYPSNQSFTRQENGLYSSTWLYQLSEEVPHGTELYISLNIPRLYGWSNDSYQTLDCLLNADFLVTVDESSSFRWEDSTTDNGVELSHVEATSEYVITQLDIPFFGWLNSTLTMPFTVEQNQIPLGCYFQLTTEDGTVLSPSSSVPPDTSLLDYTGYKGVEQCYLLDHGDRSYPETQEFMIGLLPMHTHTTGVIEVAKDLKTARGCWLSPGHETFAEDGKGEGTWAWSKIGADFIQEDGVWKVWRMRVYGCIQCGYHTCWTDMPPYQGSLPEAHCDRPVRSVANYHPDYVYPADEPLPPEPYETYDDVGYIW